MPTHYTLRHYESYDIEALRNWKFQAARGGGAWVTIREHTKDAALDKKGKAHTWDLPEAPSQFFNRFRVLQTGPNSNGNKYLACSGFEIYGTLESEEKVEASARSGAKAMQNKELVTTLEYKYDFDGNGLMNWLGTRAHTLGYMNPMDQGDVEVLSTGLMGDSKPLSAIVGKETVRCVLKPMKENYFVIKIKDYVRDLGRVLSVFPSLRHLLLSPPCWPCSASLCIVSFVFSSVSLRVRVFRVQFISPTGYTLKHYASWDVEALRNWDLEGTRCSATHPFSPPCFLSSATEGVR